MQNGWEKLDEPKKEHPGSVDLLVGKNNPGGMVMAQKQATGTKKSSEQIAHYHDHTKQKDSKQAATIQKNSEHFAHYLLTIITRRGTMGRRSIQS
jgi:hypothetical protein